MGGERVRPSSPRDGVLGQKIGMAVVGLDLTGSVFVDKS